MTHPCRSGLAGFASLILVAGCAPLSAPPPVHFLETAKTLDRGQHAGMLALGAGRLKNLGDPKGSGVAGRYRYGLTGRQELGADLLVIGVKSGYDATPTHPWLGNSNVVSGKVAWKVGAASWVALLAGLGGSNAATGSALGGDLGVVFSLPDKGQRFRPYLGIRTAYVTPVGRPTDDAGGPTRTGVLALGGAYRAGDRYRILLDLAAYTAANKGYGSTDTGPTGTILSSRRGGSFIALGVERVFGGAPDGGTPAPTLE